MVAEHDNSRLFSEGEASEVGYHGVDLGSEEPLKGSYLGLRMVLLIEPGSSP